MSKNKMVVTLITITSILMTLFAIPGPAFAVSELPDPAAWYKFDGNGNDSSGNGNNSTTISTKGDSGITYVTGVDGKAAKFDGASYFEVPHSDSLNLGNNYTLSAWIYKEDIRPSRNQPILEKRGVAEDENGLSYALIDLENTETYLKFYDENEQGSHVSIDTNLDFHKWQLLSVTNDGQYVKFYIDGVLYANKQAKNNTPESSGSLIIGCTEWDDTSFFNGIMDDLMIFNVTLTPAQIKNYYTSIATGSGKPVLDMGKKLVAHYKFEGDYKDASGNAHNGPTSQVTGISFVQGKLGKSAKFNGAALLEVADSNLLDLGNTLTFSLWACNQPNGETGDYPILYKAKSSLGDGDDPSYTLAESQGDTFVNMFNENRQSSHVNIAQEINPNVWYHLAVTCENNVMKFYYNGVLKGVKPFKGFIPHSSGNLFIGWGEWGSDYFYKGTMDDLRIYNYALSATEIKKLSVTTDKLVASPTKADSLKVKASTQLKVTLTSVETGKVANVTAAAIYTTSNAKIAKVSKGKITGVAKGKATITITYGPHTTTVPVVVK